MHPKKPVLGMVAAGTLVLLGIAVLLRWTGTEAPPPAPLPAAVPKPLPAAFPAETPPPAVLSRPPETLPAIGEANPLDSPKDAVELSKVLNDWASKDEEVRDDALSRIHNYLVEHPQEMSLRLALHHAVASDPSEKVRKHAVALFAISASDESFRFVLERSAVDASAGVKLDAVERLAKVAEPDYWVWLAKGSTREEARERQRARMAQVRQTLDTLARSPDAAVARSAQEALARIGR